MFIELNWNWILISVGNVPSVVLPFYWNHIFIKGMGTKHQKLNKVITIDGAFSFANVISDFHENPSQCQLFAMTFRFHSNESFEMMSLVFQYPKTIDSMDNDVCGVYSKRNIWYSSRKIVDFVIICNYEFDTHNHKIDLVDHVLYLNRRIVRIKPNMKIP